MAKERKVKLAQKTLEAEEEAERKAERRRARPGRAAYGASIVPFGAAKKKKTSKERREAVRAFGGVSGQDRDHRGGLRAAKHWEASEASGQTKFERQPEDIDPSEIRAIDIVHEHNTSAAWNFLGLITSKLRALAEPTGKKCKAEKSPFAYAPSGADISKYRGVPEMWRSAERKLQESEAEMKKEAARARARAKRLKANPPKRVCLPVPLAGDRFEWYVVEDTKKWDHLMSLRSVIKAAIDKRLDGTNLEVSLQEAVRDLNAAEIKVFQAALKEAYDRPKPPPRVRKKLAMWHAAPAGPWYIKVRDPATGKLKRKRVPYEEYRRYMIRIGERPASPHPIGWEPETSASSARGFTMPAGEAARARAYGPHEPIPEGIPQWLIDEMEGRPWTRAQLTELETPSPELEHRRGRRRKTFGEEAGDLPPRGRARIGSSPFAPITPKRAARMLSEMSDEEVAGLGARKIYKRLLTPEEQRIFLSGQAARLKASRDPKVRAARQKVEAIRSRIAKQRAIDEKRREFRRKEMEREESGKPLTKDEYIWGIEYVAEAKERRKGEEREDPFKKYEPADEKLWNGVVETMEKEGLTGRMITAVRRDVRARDLAGMEAIYEKAPTASRKRAIRKVESEIKGLERKLNLDTDLLKWDFGPFKRAPKLPNGRRAAKAPDFGATYGPYIPATDMTKLLFNTGRVSGATGKSDVEVKEGVKGLTKEEFEKLIKESGLEGTKEDSKRARTPIGRLMSLAKQRQDGDEERIAIIKSKGAIRKALEKQKRFERDRDWERRRMTGRKPAIKVSDEEIERKKKNLIKRHRKIVNARARTAQLVVYEEMGGREASLETALERAARRKRKAGIRVREREEGETFEIGKGAFQMKAAFTRDAKPPDPKRPWVWALFEPGSARRQLISGHAADKGHASSAIERAYNFYRDLILRASSDEKLEKTIEKKIKSKLGKKLEAGEITDEEYGAEAQKLFEEYATGGYDGLPRKDRRWLRESKPKISKAIAALLKERMSELVKVARKEAKAGKKDGPATKMLQYIIRESGVFEEGSAAAVAKIKEEQHLRRMGLREERNLSGRGYKIRVKKLKDKWQFQVITSDGRKSTVIRSKGGPKEIEAKARAIAGSMLGADKVAKAMVSSNPESAIRRLNSSARKYFRQKNPGIPREAAELGGFEDMGGMFQLPGDAKEAYKLGFYSGIIKGIDTCGVQNWAKRKKLRKEFEKRMVEGLLRFQERMGVRKAPKPADDVEPYYEGGSYYE